jgi:hypothetical protein
LTEKSIGAAANRCGVAERTLRRWMADDEPFKRELTEARRALFKAAWREFNGSPAPQSIRWQNCSAAKRRLT